MKITKYEASAALQPYIRNFITAETVNQEDYRLLPDTAVIISVRLKGLSFNHVNGLRQDLSISTISGLRHSPRLVGYSAGTSSFLIVLRESACSSFFNEPVSELFEDSVPLESMITRVELHSFEENMVLATNDKAKIMIAEQFLLSRLKGPLPDRRILKAVECIRLNQGQIRVAALAAFLNISQDTLEKNFSKFVDVSPKQFARIIRFRSLIQKYPAGQQLVEAAYRAGYFDQSHFIREFKTFTGMTPGQFSVGSMHNMS